MTELLVNAARTYQTIFEKNGLDVQIMPLKPENKNPRFRHKGGTYNGKKALEKTSWTLNGTLCNFGWLMNDQVFCIDLDGTGESLEEKQESASRYYDKFVHELGWCLDGAWVEKTRKGYHIIWKKPESMKELTTGVDVFREAGYPGIDFVTESGGVHNGVKTKSILCVHPSKDKQWDPLHHPKDVPLKEPPKDVEQWILSNIRKPKSKTTKSSTTTSKKIPVSIKAKVPAHGTALEIAELKLILKHLPAKYYEDAPNGGIYSLWKKVLCGIQYLMGSDGYNTWVEFNKRASCWSEEMHEKNTTKYWYPTLGQTVEKPVTLGSFRFWIKSDEPEKWKQIKKETALGQRNACLNGEIYTLAQYSCLILDNLIYSTRTHEWCKFTPEGWILGYERVLVDLNEQIKPVFSKWKFTLEKEKEKLEVLAKKTDCTDDILKNKEMRKILNKICKMIGNTPEKVIKQMQAIASVDAEFNANPWLLGFKGGDVYDLQEKSFRKAEMSDMVSMTTAYTSNEVCNASNVDEVQQFLEDILPDKEVRDYQLYLFALALNGIEAKRFCCQNGSGANGKSTLFDLIKHSFGDYCKNISTEHYTTPMRQGGPRPDLLDLDKTRMFIATEPGEGERLNSAAIKKMTGGDPIRCRGMWQGNTVEFHVVGQSNMLCNVRLVLDGVDGGIKRRIVNIYYPVKFVNSPNADNPLEKLANPSMKTRAWSEDHGAALLNILIGLHDTAIDEMTEQYQLEPPKQILESTADWVTDSLPFRAWLNEHFTPWTPDVDEADVTRIEVRELHKTFMEQVGRSFTAREKRTWGRKKCLETLLESDKDWLTAYEMCPHRKFAARFKVLSNGPPVNELLVE